MKINIKDINQFLSKPNFFEESDIIYNKQVEESVELIIKNMQYKPIVLLCGPSGANKTTTAKKITEKLLKRNINCGVLSMDDYFFSLTPQEKMSADSTNLEMPERVDFNLFNHHLNKLILNEEIVMPQYDFILSKRTDNKTLLSRKSGVIIVEGLHALNHNYVKYMDNCTKIYINVGCDISLYSGHIYKANQIRLLRRICRDRVHRNRDVLGTINQFKNVLWGEENFVIPFKKNADKTINTFSYYELSCYKYLLDDTLNDQFKEIVGLEEIFNKIISVDPKNIPSSSHIKEFV